jgi:cellulose synthase/poly-beta-1,6-N-acetylglucosamine synthase-like glycosyltransferase
VAAAAFGAYTYLGYPALLALLVSVRRKRPAVPRLAYWPRITIVLPAYNEEAVVRGTLDNLLTADYPADRRRILVVSDASTDGTDAAVSEYADRGVELLRLPRRGGKTVAENAAFPLLETDIVVNTDASVRVERGAIKALVGRFVDPRVGVASSHNVSVASVEDHANYAESWYVGYDMWVRGLESELCGIVGAAGCLYAARASTQCHALPEWISRDFAAALLARESGLRAVSVREALCFVPRIGSLRREYRRKVRTITRGIETLYFKRALLNPCRFGIFSWVLASHKACRWLVPHVSVLAMLALACLAPHVVLARWALGVALLAGLCAGIAWLWPDHRRLPRLIAIPAYVVIGNLAALVASIRACAGDLDPVWEPTRREAVQTLTTSGS